MQKLIAEADVFVTNFRKEALSAMGLNFDTLKEKYPKLIFTHILGFGEKGSEAKRPSFDFTAFFARTGFMKAMADPDGPPTINTPGFGDNQLAMFLPEGSPRTWT